MCVYILFLCPFIHQWTFGLHVLTIVLNTTVGMGVNFVVLTFLF